VSRSARAAIAIAAIVLAVSAPAAQAANGGVLVVGDSLEVLTSPYLKQYLPGVALTVDAQGGYNSYQIRELFEESYDPSQSVVVFDAGTNDDPAYPQILAENLTGVAAAIGDRCMVVPTIHGLTVNGIDSGGKNQVVASFAASRPGTQVPDWARVAETHPQLMQADGLHPTPAGAEYRARLIAGAVKACFAFMEPPRPVLQTAPTLPTVGKLAARQGSLLRATAIAALLTMVGSYA
jgi:lysophospholipase L1-like esterase